jgi:translation initiation factor IF-1
VICTLNDHIPNDQAPGASASRSRRIERKLRRSDHHWSIRPMAKEELLEFEGQVEEALPDGRFRIKLDNGHEIVAYTSGRMKKNRIRAIAGDRVRVEMSPYDLGKGRMIFRNSTSAGPRTGQQRRAKRFGK